MKLAIVVVLGLAVAVTHADPKDDPKARAHAVYVEALAAFQAGDFERAGSLAAHVIIVDGPDRPDAEVLYGDTLFKRGEFQRAKDVYTALLAKTPTADRRTTIEKKIASCDRELASPPPPALPTPPAKHPPLPDGDALYAQAVAAFQANDLERTLELAKHAIERGGTHQRDATVLYGDALFKRGELQRAKTIYLGLREKSTGDLRGALARKVIACNKGLALPNRDGLVD